MNKSSFVWVEDRFHRRNQYVRFERKFMLAAKVETFPVHCFADTRYRLWVNGEFVATGPGRFVTQFPEYDSHELSGLLGTGENTIRVEVNFFGASSFQSMPDGQPGFIAWGGDSSVDLATPGDWRAFRLEAWRWDAPLFSFAQNPVEICDTRISEAGIPVDMVSLKGEAAPWGELMPYSGAPLTYFIHRPKRIELAARLDNAEQRIGFMTHDPDSAERALAGEGEGRLSTAFATWILSPRAQAVTLSCFWSDLECNGEAVAVDTDTPFGNHGHCTLPLHEGWNLLTGKLSVLTEFWAYCLGIPVGSGLTLHGRRDVSCFEPLAVGPLATRDSLQLPTKEDPRLPQGWTLHDGNPNLLTPARIMGWDNPAGDALHGLPFNRLSEVSTIEACEATWCFSFSGEFLGHAVIEVEAPEGSTLDVAYDDWQAESGGAALYQSNPFTDAADRFILRGGCQRIEVFHPRGGKYLQATLRAPGPAASLTLQDVFIRSRQSQGKDETRFTCDHAVLEWAWPVAMRTLAVSTDDAYSDSPWRERSSYIGDCHVNLHLNLLLNADPRTARRTLRLFGQAQTPDGRIDCCAPSWLRLPHEDFTLIWVLALHDLWALTGDVSVVEEMWPAVRRVWESPLWERHESGLWNTTGKRLFIDWGVILSEREGEANAVINLLRYGAAKACAAMAGALGRFDESAAFLADSRAVEEALLGTLWDESKGCFTASLGAHTPALHANVFALAFGVGNEALRTKILAYLEPKLRGNFAKGMRKELFTGYLELFFFHFALPALANNGRPDLAELLIDEHYEYLRKTGDETFPEQFGSYEARGGSRCHSWAGAPAIYAARYVLGIRPAEPGNPRKLIFDPIVHSITRASGRIAHPDGWIEVSWDIRKGKVRPIFQAPAGVEILPFVPTFVDQSVEGTACSAAF